jgi:hypothetical protein
LTDLAETPELSKMASSGDEDNGDPVPNTKRHRHMMADDKKAVFYGIRSTMVDDRPKHGITVFT